MRPTDLAPKAFSTAGLPAARRVELWETHNATALIGLDVEAGEPLVAEQCEDGTHALRPGNVLICETDQPFARGFRRGLEELVVKVHRAAIPEVTRLRKPPRPRRQPTAPPRAPV